jgi:hypothetical protein
MATTPPLRIISVHEPPPTPRHGPVHDDLEPRYSTRSSQRIPSRETKSTPEPSINSRPSRQALTPETKRVTAQSSRHNLSPPLSPQKSPRPHTTRHVQVVSPSSPGAITRAKAASPTTSASNPSSKQNSFLSSSTVMAEGMLPTPVKTPRKKVVPNIKAAARALFQEQPTASEEIMPTPRKNRKSRRHNGFSLETLATEDGNAGGPVQIFTDSRDNVPEFDPSGDNPFVEHRSEGSQSSVKKLNGTSKRRKVSSDRKKDPQVEEAIKHDEGMVYVL